MKINMLSFVLVLACSLAVSFTATTKAGVDQKQTIQTPAMPEVEELKLIHADSMTLTRQKEKPQVFEGSVDILMRDKAGNETGIKADKITIYYKADLKKVERIEAEGQVRISRLGTVAMTELAVFQGDKNIIELLVDPHVKDSRGELSANKIVIHLDSDEVIAEGNVRGIVHPGTLEKATSK